MSIVIDLIILAIFVICVLLGYKKGLTGSVIKIVSFIIALVVAFILFKPVSSIIINCTNWDENLEQSIREFVIQNNNDEQTSQNQEGKGMPDIIMNYINDAVQKAGNDAKEAIVDSTAHDVAITIINGAVLVALYIISRIILLLIKGITNLLTELPLIKQVDKLGGIIYGLLQALITVYIILAIVSFISPMIAETGVIKAIQESYAGSMLYNNNLLLKLIF